ncbi:MAG: ribonuclease R [Tabrizicola sp.]|uniref:ribonuclease R n=1 Tax=Tabrizicola sp. TaxID=2005166 RepID=UPI002736435E|nr:ribonuclease R [Tabrizicola sp.]MDP3262378.1 ribonuclease R [Tabrizicola sp.]MDP3647875.1 ribonuclease R [Paracoccaceae bacterium]MDZ4066133.1 ribonuclease R [Tabrizicola sp.]
MNPIPTKDQIRAWIAENPGLSAKRDIAKAFGIKGDARIDLKRLLKEMEAEGSVEKTARRFHDKDSLPPVAVLMVLAPDTNGDLFARPLEDGADETTRILIIPKAGDPPLGEGDRILARLAKVDLDEYHYEARLIRRIGSNPLKLLGIFRANAEGGRIVPIDKGADKEWRVSRDMTMSARDGELVEAEAVGNRKMGLPQARISARLGDPSGPRAVSLIAIHQHGIPDQFPDAVIAEADAARPAPDAGRVNLRDIPLVTIDPIDARDRDDAVYAEPDHEPGNPGGHILWIAIADVAHYVTPGSALDREARKRGNSTYFPDRVVPMLPDVLSGDLCSLHEHVDRACLAVRMRIDESGHKISHRFVRGIMRSAGSLHYAQVQAAIDGQPDDVTAPLLDPILRPLYAAYASLTKARALRQPLDLDLPERKIVLDDDGKVTSVAFRDRLDAHRLIEEFMIAANVAAAEELIRLKRPLLFRVHEEPSVLKLDALREVAEASGFTLAKGQVLKTAHLNRLLAQAEGTEFDELMNISTLRSMTQAYYHPENFGHFGLALQNYAHFTSPIRRYSDLIVHRALIAGHKWGDDGLSQWDIENLEETAKLISDAERRSMAAERDTTDRYLAAFLADRVGAEFAGRISGVQRFGLFVKLDETGADGLIPIRAVGREFFHYDEGSQTLMGADTGVIIGIGQKVTVRLAEATPVTGGITLDLLEIEGKPLTVSARKGGRFAPRKPTQAAAKRRGVVRKRR